MLQKLPLLNLFVYIGDMRIVHISDLHFTRLRFNPLRLYSKRFLAVLNWMVFRRPGFDKSSLTSLPEFWRELQVDLVLVGGDLSTTALPSEFEEARAFFDQHEGPALFIPGNHDHYTRGAYRGRRFYKSFANPCGVGDFSLADKSVEVHALMEGWWCVALDTARPTSLFSSNGYFTSELERNLLTALDSIPRGDRIVMLNHFPFFKNDFPRHHMVRGERLRQILEERSNIVLYLHGHTHRQTIADLQPNSLPLVLDSGCPIQRHQGSWNLIELSKEGCVVHPYRWVEKKWMCKERREFVWTRS